MHLVNVIISYTLSCMLVAINAKQKANMFLSFPAYELGTKLPTKKNIQNNTLSLICDISFLHTRTCIFVHFSNAGSSSYVFSM